MTTIDTDIYTIVLGTKAYAEKAPVGDYKEKYFEALWENTSFSDLINKESGWTDTYKYFLREVFKGDINAYFTALKHAVTHYKSMENEKSMEYQAWLFCLNTSITNLPKLEPLYHDSGLEVACQLWKEMSGTQHQGKVNSLIRTCAEAYDKETVNGKFENFLSEYSEVEVKELRDLAAEGMIKKIGPWKVWLLIRDMLFGKTKKVEPENATDQRIVIIKAKLEVLFTIPITPENAELIDEQNKFMNELRNIDPEANVWLKGNAPSNRLGTE